jgi:hypothetical protein
LRIADIRQLCCLVVRLESHLSFKNRNDYDPQYDRLRPA